MNSGISKNLNWKKKDRKKERKKIIDEKRRKRNKETIESTQQFIWT